MAQIIQKGKELIRINPEKRNEIQYSTNNGSTWHIKYSSLSKVGNFIDLIDCGDEIMAIANNGESIYYSDNNGSSWYVRYSTSSNVGNFHSLVLNGSEILGTTNKGLHYSTNKGNSWYKK